VVLGVSIAQWRGFLYPPYAGGVLFQCGVLALLLLWAWPRSHPRSAQSRAWILLASYAVVSAASCLWAQNTRLAAIGAIPVLFCIVWALLLGRLLRDRVSLRFLGRAIFLGGALAATLGIYHVISAQKITAVKMALGHRNFLAIFLLPPLLLGMADLISWIAARRRRTDASATPDDVLGLAPAFVIAGMALMLGALALCTSFGAMLGLGAGILCLCATILSRRRLLMIVAAVALVGVAGLVVLALPPVTKWLLEHHPSQATRWFMWQGCLQMISERPVFGWGTGMFMPYFADFKPTEPMRYGLLTDITLYPHCEFLLVAVEGGMIALVLYIGGLFVAMRRHVTAIGGEANAGQRMLSRALFAGFVAMTVQGIVSVALRFWAPSALYWTLAGVLLAFPGMKESRHDGDKPKSALAIFRFAIVTILVAAVAWGVVWSGARAESLAVRVVKGRRLSAEEFDKRAAEAVVRSRYLPDRFIAMQKRVIALLKLRDLNGAIAVCEQAEKEAPGLGPTRIVLGDLYLHRARETGKAAGGGVEDLKRSADILDLAIKQNPFNATARVKYAMVAMLLSPRNLPLALEHANAALEAEPENPLAHYGMGVLLAQKGERGPALDAFGRAEALCKDTNAGLLKRIRGARANLTRDAASPETPGEPDANQ